MLCYAMVCYAKAAAREAEAALKNNKKGRGKRK